MSKRTQNSVTLDDLLEAILKDDRAKAKKFLDADQSLAVAKKMIETNFFKLAFIIGCIKAIRPCIWLRPVTELRLWHC